MRLSLLPENTLKVLVWAEGADVADELVEECHCASASKRSFKLLTKIRKAFRAAAVTFKTFPV